MMKNNIPEILFSMLCGAALLDSAMLDLLNVNDSLTNMIILSIIGSIIGFVLWYFDK